MPIAAAPELGDLAVIIVALAALLILLAARLLAQLMVGLFRQVPLIGGWVADNLLDHVVDALTAMIGWIGSSVGPMAAFLWRPVAWFVQLNLDVEGALVAGVEALDRVVRFTIPAAVVGAAVSAVNLYNAAVAFTAAVEARLVTWATGELNALRGALAAESIALVGFVTAEAAVAAAFTRAEVAAGVSAAEGYAYSAIVAEAAAIRREVDAVEAAAAAAIATEGAALRAQFAAVSTLAADADTLAREALNEAAGIPAIAAAAVAAIALPRVLAVERELTDYLDRCGNDLCKGLGNLSRIVQALETIMEGGALVAFLAEAAHDPNGLAGEIAEVGGPLARDAATGIRDLVGLAA